MVLQNLLGIEFPIIQAPMAGVQGSALAVAVSNAGGLGSLPCAMLSIEAMRKELAAHPCANHEAFQREFLFPHAARGRTASEKPRGAPRLSPYFKEYGIDASTIPAGPGRMPFGAEAADVLSEVRPAVVSFHFGLPAPDLLARARSCGAKILSSATTVDEARWLEAHGVDAVIAQGLEAGGHRGIFLSQDLGTQIGTFALVPQIVRAVKNPGYRCGRHCGREGRGGCHGTRRDRRANRHGLPVVRGSHHKCSAPRIAEERRRPRHRAHQSLHREAHTWNREPPDERTRPHQCRGACRFRWRHRLSHRCAPQPKAWAAAIFRRCGLDKTRADAKKSRQPWSRASWRAHLPARIPGAHEPGLRATRPRARAATDRSPSRAARRKAICRARRAQARS